MTGARRIALFVLVCISSAVTDKANQTLSTTEHATGDTTNHKSNQISIPTPINATIDHTGKIENLSTFPTFKEKLNSISTDSTVARNTIRENMTTTNRGIDNHREILAKTFSLPVNLTSSLIGVKIHHDNHTEVKEIVSMTLAVTNRSIQEETTTGLRTINFKRKQEVIMGHVAVNYTNNRMIKDDIDDNHTGKEIGVTKGHNDINHTNSHIDVTTANHTESQLGVTTVHVGVNNTNSQIVVTGHIGVNHTRHHKNVTRGPMINNHRNSQVDIITGDFSVNNIQNKVGVTKLHIDTNNTSSKINLTTDHVSVNNTNSVMGETRGHIGDNNTNSVMGVTRGHIGFNNTNSVMGVTRDHIGDNNTNSVMGVTRGHIGFNNTNSVMGETRGHIGDNNTNSVMGVTRGHIGFNNTNSVMGVTRDHIGVNNTNSVMSVTRSHIGVNNNVSVMGVTRSPIGVNNTNSQTRVTMRGIGITGFGPAPTSLKSIEEATLAGYKDKADKSIRSYRRNMGPPPLLDGEELMTQPNILQTGTPMGKTDPIPPIQFADPNRPPSWYGMTTPSTTIGAQIVLVRTTPYRLSFQEDCDYLAYYCLKAYDTGKLCGRTLYYTYHDFPNYCMLDYVNCMERFEVWQVVHMGECFEIEPLIEYKHYPYENDYFLDQYYIVEDLV